MRTAARFAALFLAVLFLSGATQNREVTGLEWLEASSRDRTESLARSMFVLQKNGVTLGRTPLEYYDDLHTWLRRHPDDYRTGLTQLLAGVVHDKEPSQRELLKNAGYRP